MEKQQNRVATVLNDGNDIPSIMGATITPPNQHGKE